MRRMVIIVKTRINGCGWATNRKNKRSWRTDQREVIGYLNSENEYREKVTAHLCDFENKLFEEIKSELSKQICLFLTWIMVTIILPVMKKEKEVSYILSRKGSQDRPEEILLDVNSMAEVTGITTILVHSKVPIISGLPTVLIRSAADSIPYSLKKPAQWRGLNESIQRLPETSFGRTTINTCFILSRIKHYATIKFYVPWTRNSGHDVEIYHEKDEAFHVLYSRRDQNTFGIGSSAMLVRFLRRQPLTEFRFLIHS